MSPKTTKPESTDFHPQAGLPADFQEAEALAGIGSFSIGKDGEFTLSPNCVHLLGLSEERSVWKNNEVLASFIKLDNERLATKLDQLIRGDCDHLSERVCRRHAGESFHFECLVERRRDLDGNDRYVGVLKDITESVKTSTHVIELQQQLQQAQKMEAIGQLTGGIAHDFNNILASIIGYNNLARAKSKHEEKVSEYLQEVADASNRARELVSQMLEFSRTRSREPAALNLVEAVDSAIFMLKSMLPSSSQIHWDKNIQANRQVRIYASEVQIQQIILNLVLNAHDAIPDTGNIYISVNHDVLSSQPCTACGIDFEGRYSVVTVTDDGHGIDDKALPRIFDPFFSTKPPGKGTGLGLSILNRIVHESFGHIAVHSRSGEGTTISLYFPVYEEVESDIDLISVSPDFHILVVDDEVTVLNYMREVLEINGFVVTTATSFQEGVRALEELEINLVITDYHMPGKTGDELIKYVKTHCSDIPCLLCTGSSNCSEAIRLQADASIEKPFRAATLLDCIGELRKNISLHA